MNTTGLFYLILNICSGVLQMIKEYCESILMRRISWTKPKNVIVTPHFTLLKFKKRTMKAEIMIQTS